MQKSRNNNGSTDFKITTIRKDQEKINKKKLSKRTAEFKGLQYSQSW